MSDLRTSVIKAFGDHLAAEIRRSKERLERAASEGVDRAAYAREQRVAGAALALEAVPEPRWQDLAHWLDRFASESEAPAVRLRPRDRKGSWTGAEQEALGRAIREIEAAVARVTSACGIDGLDVEQQSGRDMEGRLGRAFHEVRYMLERVSVDLSFAIGRLKEPASTFDDPDIDEPLPFELSKRRPASRAFPELMRFWVQEAGRSGEEKALFLTFARAALVAVAAKSGDSPAEWTAGLDEAFKQR